MRRLIMAIVVSVSALGTAHAQTEARMSVGVSDMAWFTGGDRHPLFRGGVEGSVGRVRIGFALSKEGTYAWEGWGWELSVGARHAFAGHAQGTFRAGAGMTMLGPSSGAFHEGPDGTYRDWTWRTVRLNVGFPFDMTAYPFMSYGVQHPVVGGWFIDGQVRLSYMPTLSQSAVGREGEMRGTEYRSWTWIPGATVGLGYRF